MDTFAPEFARFWLDDDSHDAVAPHAMGDDSTNEEAALRALAERVSAARTIV